MIQPPNLWDREGTGVIYRYRHSLVIIYKDKKDEGQEDLSMVTNLLQRVGDAVKAKRGPLEQ